MKKNCLIVDNEPLAQDVLEAYIEKIDNLVLVKKCGSAIEAAEVLQNYNIDLMFLDIQMPKITGLEFIKLLDNPPLIILVTAYREYAVDGFELNVLDFFIKPVSFERFLTGVNRFFDKVNKIEKPDNSDNYFYVKESRRMVKIMLSQIAYIESLKDYIKIAHGDGYTLTKQSIGELEELLPDGKFIRVHRSHIVAIDKITAYTNTTVELGDRELPIGRSYKEDLHRILNNKPLT